MKAHNLRIFLTLDSTVAVHLAQRRFSRYPICRLTGLNRQQDPTTGWGHFDPILPLDKQRHSAGKRSGEQGSELTPGVSAGKVVEQRIPRGQSERTARRRFQLYQCFGGFDALDVAQIELEGNLFHHPGVQRCRHASIHLPVLNR